MKIDKYLKLLLLTFIFGCFSNRSNAEVHFVKNVGNGTGAGELRGEIQTAAAGDTIIIDAAGVLNLTASINVNQDVVIIGPSAKHFVINAAALGSGTVFNNSEVKFKLIGIKIENAVVPIFKPSGNASLEIFDCSFKNNSGHVFSSLASYNDSTFFMNCSFGYNSNSGSGSVFNIEGGNVLAVNCTFYSNSSDLDGGVVFVDGPASYESINCTYVNNNSNNNGGAIYAIGEVYLRNNIFGMNNSGGGGSTRNFMNGGAAWNSDGGNIIDNSPAQISFLSQMGSDQFNMSPNFGIAPSEMEDGYGLEHFPIQDNASDCLDVDDNTFNDLPEFDARKIWREIEGFVDAGACEYTPYRITNTASTGPGSLDDVMAMLSGSPDIKNAIIFEIAPYPGSSPYIINPDNEINIDKKNTIISGFTQPGSIVPGPGITTGNLTPGYMRIVLDGSSSGSGNGLVFMPSVSQQSSVGGLSFMNCFDNHILIQDRDVRVYGCHVGVNEDGMNAGISASGAGINIDGPTVSDVIIGVGHYHLESFLNERNVIAGSPMNVIVNGGGLNEVRNSVIGLRSDANDVPTNVSATTHEGIVINGGIDNMIGGDYIKDRNIIGGCMNGIQLRTNNNYVANNIIGSDASGLSVNSSLGNVVGINLFGVTNNLIGDAKAGNIIGNNQGEGILLDGSTNNLIVGNYIGLGADGITALGNGNNGIKSINGSNYNEMGLPFQDEGNFICHNGENGIQIETTGGVQDTIANNFIGVDIGGNPAGNINNGISILAGAGEITVGGIDPFYSNEIANNGGAGIVGDVDAFSVYIAGNSIHNNVGLGIDLDADGAPNITPGTPPTSNSGQIPPEIIAAFDCSGGATSTNVAFRCDFQGNYFIDFYKVDSDGQEGQDFLDRATVFVPAAGDELVHILPVNIPAGQKIIAVATRMDNRSSSEFSAAYAVTAPPSTPTVTPLTQDVCDGNTPSPFTSSATHSRWFAEAALTTLISNSASYNPGVQPIGIHNYYAVDSSAGCYSPYTQAILTINANPSPSITGNATVCEGASEAYSVTNNAGNTYAWNVNGGSFDASGNTSNESVTWFPPSAASIDVVETDLNGCFGSDFVSITINSNPTANVSGTTNVSCSGGNDGQAVATGSGGAGPYVFTWAPAPGSGQGTSNASGFTAGNYDVMVTDASNCSSPNVSFTITEPTPLVLTMSSTDVLCNGNATGTATVTVSGGTLPYNYLWGNSQITATATGLVAGAYGVDVTDGKSCTDNNVAVVTEPPVLASSITFIEPSCNGLSDGSVNLSVSGGTIPYLFDWDNDGTGDYDDAEDLSGLTAGTYNVSIQDGNGCFHNDAINVTQPPVITYTTVNSNNMSCFGVNDGAIEIVGASGGTGALSYSIDGGTTFQSGNTFGALSDGTYPILIGDATGCSIFWGNVIITEPTQISVSAPTSTNPSCNGSTNGSANITTPTGGTPSYSYQWYNNSGPTIIGGMTTSSATGLGAGIYYCEVKDANLCPMNSPTVSLVEPSALIPDAGVNQTVCSGSTVTLSGSAVGGTPSYTHSWDNSVIDGSPFVPASTTTYTLTTEDGFGCTASSTVDIIVDPLPIVSPGPDLNVCANNASVSLFGSVTNAAGGNWSSSGTGTFSPSTTDLNAGYIPSAADTVAGSVTITLTSTGNGSCSAVSNSFTLSIAPGIYAHAGTDQSVCADNMNVNLSGSVSGSTNTGEWSSSGSGVFTPSTTDLNAVYKPSSADSTSGSVTLTLTSTNNGICNGDTDDMIITILSSPVMTPAVADISCNGLNDGQITLTGSSGAGSYTYSIDNGATFQGLPTFGGQSAGSYNVQIKDANGCLSPIQTVGIAEPSLLSINILSTSDATCFGLGDGVMVSNAATGGVSPYTYQWVDNAGTPVSGEINLTTSSSLSAGVYSIQAMDNNGCTAQSPSASILEPAEIIMSVNKTDPLCFGNNNGTITVDVTSGGVSPYTFSNDAGGSYTPGTLPHTFTGLAAGTFSVNVTDANGCANQFQSITLVDPAQMSLDFSVTNETCFGDGDGEINMTINGGTGPYQIDWDNDGTGDMDDTEDLINLSPALYQVMVQDASGCSSGSGAAVGGPAALTFTAVPFRDTCSLGIGEIQFTNVTGGTSPYGYTIDGGATTSLDPIFTEVSAGTYTVVVGDINGCIQGHSIIVGDTIGELPANMGGVNDEYLICPGMSTQIEAFGGDSYAWFNTFTADTTDPIQEVAPTADTYYYVSIKLGSCSRVDSTIVKLDESLNCDEFEQITNNVFSPDGDQVNDNFVIGIDHLLADNENTVTIFNRWGDEINNYSNYNNGDVSWDGTNKSGVFVTNGTYYYVIEIPAINYSSSGWVQVIR